MAAHPALSWFHARRSRSQRRGRRLPSETGGESSRCRAFDDSLGLCRCPLHGPQDPQMRTASAEIAGECLSNLLVAWISRLAEKRSGLHDHAVDAIATLHRLFVDKSLLHGMRFL